MTNGSKNILVDTSSELMRRLLRVRLADLRIHHIDLLIITHSHPDHTGNARMIRKEYKSTVLIHEQEAPYLTCGKTFFPDGSIPITRIIMSSLRKWAEPLFKSPSCKYDIPVKSYYDLKKFGFNAYIMHTPGHTPGSVSVIIDDEIALVGDTMFGVIPGSVFPPFASDVRQLIISWGKLLDTKCTLFIPSHGSSRSRSQLQKGYNTRI